MADFILLGEQLITEFLTQIQKELVAYMQVEDRNATGKSAASIQVVNVTNSTGQLVGNQNIEYVFRGRGPGKMPVVSTMPPYSAIVDWCNARGIPRGAAWIIAKRISENGTKLHQALKAAGKNSKLDDFITEAKLEKFKSQIIATFVAELKTKIDFTQIGIAA